MRRATPFLLPSFAGSKAQRGKKASQPVVGLRAAGRTQKRDALNHELILSRGRGGRSAQPAGDQHLS